MNGPEAVQPSFSAGTGTMPALSHLHAEPCPAPAGPARPEEVQPAVSVLHTSGTLYVQSGWLGAVQGDSLLQLGAAHAPPGLTGVAAPSDRQQAGAGTAQTGIIDGQGSPSKQAARVLMPPQPPAGEMQHLRAAAGLQAGQVGCLPFCCGQTPACEGPEACTIWPCSPGYL